MAASSVNQQGARRRRILYAILLLLNGALSLAEPVSLRDPTQPPAEIGTAVIESNPGIAYEGVRLTTILFSPQRKLAIINNQIAQIGDKVGDIQVLAITPQSVRVRDLKQQGQEFTLTLANPVVKVITGTKPTETGR